MKIREFIGERLTPLVFAAGLAIGFSFCQYWGGVYSQRNPFPNFVRFYQALAPSSNFFVTVNQLVALSKSRVSKDDILVVVGGNSTFLGVAQPVDDLWTKHLNQNLGPGYVVINMAQRGSAATGAAESVAEAMLKQGYKVIYVANVLPPNWGEPDGNSTYSYMYWNARYRGLLFPWEVRERYFASGTKPGASRTDMKIRARMDSFSNAEDFWNTLCYSEFCTAWDSLTGIEFWKPRQSFRDQEGPPLPVPERFAGDRDRMVEVIRSLVKLPGGTALEPNIWPELRLQAEAGFVPQMRSRTLIVVSSFSPYYVHRMSADEQDRYRDLLRRTVLEYRGSGLHSIESGSLYDDGDYKDSVHMVPSGGRRLASEVAPQVRRIANELYR